MLSSAVTTPIQNVPNDVLQEIFLECLPSEYWTTTIEPSQIPVLFTHVCQTWRNVAFACPLLWRSLRWSTNWERVGGQEIDTFSAAVAHAKSAPRNLQVILSTRLPLSNPKRKSSFKSMPHIPSRVVVGIRPFLTKLLLRGVPISHIHDLASDSFPSLVLLALYLEGQDLEGFPWAAKGPIRAFSNAPGLRRVALGSSLDDDYQRKTYVSPNILLPREQLTHILDLASPNHGRHSISDYIRKSQNLRFLVAELHYRDVGVEGWEHWRGRSVDPTMLDNLESLTINYWGAGGDDIGYPAFVDSLQFPNLKSLRLDGAEFCLTDPLFWTEVLINRFIARLSSLHHLTYLSLCATTIDPVSFRRILSATPNITTLDAQIFENYRFFFEAISWNPADMLLPKLETLVLELDDSEARSDGEGETINPDIFEGFLESRLRNDTLFRKIVVYSSQHSYMDGDIAFVAVAQKYASRGLVLERRCVTVERDRKAGFEWLERDPDLQDWPELAEMLFIVL